MSSRFWYRQSQEKNIVGESKADISPDYADSIVPNTDPQVVASFAATLQAVSELPVTSDFKEVMAFRASGMVGVMLDRALTPDEIDLLLHDH